MGPSEDRSAAGKNQVGHFQTGGPGRRSRRPQGRVCLLKGCERRFRPVHPMTRYCGEGCREGARRWREWKARHRYRQSEGGKQKRRAQSRRYRIRRQRARAASPRCGKTRDCHRKKNYLLAPAIDLAAMKSSGAGSARRCKDLARSRVGGLWSGFWSESDAGGNAAGVERGFSSTRRRCWGERPEIVRRYCASSSPVNKFTLHTSKRKRERSQAEVEEVPAACFVLSSSMLWGVSFLGKAGGKACSWSFINWSFVMNGCGWCVGSGAAIAGLLGRGWPE